ncbi:MAG: hypothetical protein K9L59_02980 [Desulfobacterales bacterium]|nr:hypothetical protein [Desulfobacterales bacterium]
MAFPELFMVIPGPPMLSILLWIGLLMLLLYFAREPAHQAIRSLSRTFHASLRLASRSLLLAERRLAGRNKDVLLASSRESMERVIEREFHRVDAVVKRDLAGYPSLQRALADQIARLEEDYRQSSELSPPTPTWVEAVEAVAKIPSNGDPTVSKVLEKIQVIVQNQQKAVMAEYRKNISHRHGLLKRMIPYWRRMTDTLEDVGKTITGLQERSAVIDRRMAEYEEIIANSDRAEQMYASSAMTQFFIAGFVLLIAFGGAVINFNLIALPMSEMVGGGSYIGQFKTADVAALVIILVEVAMGLYLMESLRITRLFPVIGSMDDRMRVRMIWITFGILLILASVESALAFMRDTIAADLHALRQSLVDAPATEPVNSWIPTVGQMALGFILPFALTFVAIPLESFVQSSRVVMGRAATGALRTGAFFLRLLATFGSYTGTFLIHFYDLLIVPPLWIAGLIQGRQRDGQILSPEADHSPEPDHPGPEIKVQEESA